MAIPMGFIFAWGCKYNSRWVNTQPKHVEAPSKPVPNAASNPSKAEELHLTAQQKSAKTAAVSRTVFIIKGSYTRKGLYPSLVLPVFVPGLLRRRVRRLPIYSALFRFEGYGSLWPGETIDQQTMQPVRVET